MFFLLNKKSNQNQHQEVNTGQCWASRVPPCRLMTLRLARWTPMTPCNDCNYIITCDSLYSTLAVITTANCPQQLAAPLFCERVQLEKLLFCASGKK